MKAMLEHASLTPEALAYFRALPLGTQVAISHSNLSFRTLEDIKAYESRTCSGMDGVLYKNLPEASVPSNSALDPLDSE